MTPAAFGDSKQWLTSLDEALERAAAKDTYVLVDLYADWCGWCKVLEEQVFTAPQFRDFTRDFVLLRVDVDDGGEGSALQARFGAYSLPTTILMDAKQVKVGSVSGFAPTAAFLQRLSAEIASYQAFLEHYERVRASDDLAALYGLSQDLYTRGDGDRSIVVLRQILKHTPPDSPKVAWLHYLMADAYRLGGRFDEAQEALGEARSMTSELKARELAERLDLLSYRIAHDSRNCDKAKKSLEHFLTEHPKSAFRREVEAALKDLRKGQGLGCA